MWLQIKPRLDTLLLFLAQQLHEPFLCQGVLVTMTNDLLNRGELAVLSGHALDWSSVVPRYRTMATFIAASTNRYIQLVLFCSVSRTFGP